MYYSDAIIGVFLVTISFGLGLAYLGLPVYRALFAVFGGIVVSIFALMVAAIVTSGDIGVFGSIVILPLAFVLGYRLANPLRRVFVAIFGFIAAAVVAWFLDALASGVAASPNVGLLVLAGAIGALLALGIETWLIILSSAFTGSVFVSAPVFAVVQSPVFALLTFGFVALTGTLFQYGMFGDSQRLRSHTRSTRGDSWDDDPYSLDNLNQTRSENRD